ncbi:MAG: hypothetical protein JW797_19985 [Bradymonadales bacterium]|nr:hypothetical protein [Bradymonadales bacterium]
MRTATWTALIALAFAACSGQDEPAESAPDATDSSTDPIEETSPADLVTLDVPQDRGTTDQAISDGTSVTDMADDVSSGELSGTWAELSVLSAIADVPIVGSVVNGTTSTQRVVIAQTGNDLTVSSEVCDLYVDSAVTLVETVFPQAFIDSLPVTERPATLARSGDNLFFDAPRFYQLRGVNLDNPETDPLPTDPQDERIYDQDEDGHPGLTVRIQGLVDGEVYVIQRAWSIYQGEVVSPGSIQGLVEWGDEQVVLGSDNPLLASPIESTPDPDPNHSYFHLVRIDSGMTCEQIVAQRDQLFGL